MCTRMLLHTDHLHRHIYTHSTLPASASRTLPATHSTAGLTLRMLRMASRMTCTILASLTTSRSHSGFRAPACTTYTIWREGRGRTRGREEGGEERDETLDSAAHLLQAASSCEVGDGPHCLLLSLVLSLRGGGAVSYSLSTQPLPMPPPPSLPAPQPQLLAIKQYNGGGGVSHWNSAG